MALYRKNAEQTSDTSVSKGDAKSSGLGRGLESLTGDNTPTEKKPLVVRRGVYPPEAERKRPPPFPSLHAGARPGSPSAWGHDTWCAERLRASGCWQVGHSLLDSLGSERPHGVDPS